MPIFVNNKQFHLQTKSVSHFFGIYEKMAYAFILGR